MTDDLEVTYERLKRSLQGRVDDLEDAAWLMHNLDHVLEAQQQTDERLEKVEAERDYLRERCFRTEEISASWAGTAGRIERERDSLRRALEEVKRVTSPALPAHDIAFAALHPTPKTEEVADAEA